MKSSLLNSQQHLSYASFSIEARKLHIKMKSSALLTVLERLVLLSWIVKDFGWMMTNIYIGFPFGILSILLHVFLLGVDRRRSCTFYNTSLLLWVIGNFLWMTCEFVDATPSSRIHTGPHVPIGGLDDKTIDSMINTKTIFLMIGVLVQLIMYTGIFARLVPVPGSDTPEDLIINNEAKLLCCRRRRTYEHTSISSDPIDFESDDLSLDLDGHGSDFSLTYTYISNFYIVFWIVKDSFWAFGTGDFGFADIVNAKDLVVFYEAGAMVAGALAIASVATSSYLVRRDVMLFLDHIVGILWLSANYCWMIGEFFLRYHNLDLDDGNEGDDMSTRIISCVLFSASFALQLYIIYSMWTHRRNRDEAVRTVEMTSSSIKYHHIMVNYAPQTQGMGKSPMHRVFDDDDEAVVLF